MLLPRQRPKGDRICWMLQTGVVQYFPVPVHSIPLHVVNSSGDVSFPRFSVRWVTDAAAIPGAQIRKADRVRFPLIARRASSVSEVKAMVWTSLRWVRLVTGGWDLLYNLGSGSWLTWANDTAAHCQGRLFLSTDGDKCAMVNLGGSIKV